MQEQMPVPVVGKLGFVGATDQVGKIGVVCRLDRASGRGHEQEGERKSGLLSQRRRREQKKRAPAL